MSYLVLARKYRPQKFDDLVGQEHLKRSLKNAISTNKVAHAYLFSGPKGVGKTTAARLLAMALNCLEDLNKPCGLCSSCLDISTGASLVTIEIDGASNRGIDEIRDLIESVSYLPAKGAKKIYIIDEVHMLTKDASNALLKTLEEPPPHVIFIFATTEAHRVLPTIVSRCLRYDFKRIKEKDILFTLNKISELEEIKIESEALQLIVNESGGGLRDALSLLDQLIAYSGSEISKEDALTALSLIDHSLVINLVQACLNGQSAKALKILNEAYKNGYNYSDLASKSLEYIRKLVIFKTSTSDALEILDLSENENSEYQSITNEISIDTLTNHFNFWLEIQSDLLFHPKPRLILEALVIKLTALKNLVPLAELTERLENLFNKIADLNFISENISQKDKPAKDEFSKIDKLTNDSEKESSIIKNKEVLNENISQKDESAKDEFAKIDKLTNNSEKESLTIKNKEVFDEKNSDLDMSASSNLNEFDFWEDFLKKHADLLGYAKKSYQKAKILEFNSKKISLDFDNDKDYKIAKYNETSFSNQLKIFFKQSPLLEFSCSDLNKNQKVSDENFDFNSIPEFKEILQILPKKENHQVKYYPNAKLLKKEENIIEEDVLKEDNI